MNLFKFVSNYRIAIYILFILLFVTSCKVQQRSTSSQLNTPIRQVNNYEENPNLPTSEDTPKQLDSIPSELLQQNALSTEVKDAEKKLGITIQENDPDTLLYTEAAKWIGVKYRYRGMDRNGVDCSGLTCLLYKSVYKKTLNRSSAGMARSNVEEIAKSELQPGDLIFFATSGNTKTITHVGVYLKDNRFIHASSRVGVVVNNLNEDYYRKTFVKCGRVK